MSNILIFRKKNHMQIYNEENCAIVEIFFHNFNISGNIIIILTNGPKFNSEIYNFAFSTLINVFK